MRANFRSQWCVYAPTLAAPYPYLLKILPLLTQWT